MLTHLNAADQQTDKTADDQLIGALIAWLRLNLLIPVEAVRVHLVFNTLLLWLVCFCPVNNDTVWYVMCSSEVGFTEF